MFSLLTVITIEELKKFYRDRKLVTSESFDFLSEDVQVFLGGVFQEMKQAEMSNLIHIHSVGGTEVTSLEQAALSDPNDDLLAYLPVLEGSQVFIITKSDKNVMLFSDAILEEFERGQFETEDELDFYKELLLDVDTEDSDCLYAVSKAIHLDDVVGIVYPEDLEEQIRGFKDSSKERDVLFKTTSLF